LIKNFFVSVHFDILKVNKKQIHNIIGLTKKELNLSIISLELNLINSQMIKEINNKYLRHNYSTDIITFNYSADINKLDGEIFISIEDANVNAKKYHCCLDEELLRLIIHGILHMTGYDDQIETDKKKMKKIENYLVNKFYFVIKNKLILYDNKIC
jgi:probable rRNA maturation factor